MSEAAMNKQLRDDTVFNQVNYFITIPDRRLKPMNSLLMEVRTTVMELMKSKDQLFKDMFQEVKFAGSFYKKTRVGKPTEFDLDLIIKLPVIYEKIRFEEGLPGYARIRLPPDSHKPLWETHRKVLDRWISEDEHYLSNDKVRKWFEGVITKSFSTLMEGQEGWFILPIGETRSVNIKVRKSGPAFTLQVVYEGGHLDLDLVPALEFNSRPNLKVFTRLLNVDQPWYLVPKPMKIGHNPQFNWRFSFFSYEKSLLSKNGKIKPVIRHLKKLRDCQNWSSVLASYYIETLVYHELHTREIDLIGSSMSSLLVHMLIKLSEACEKQCIPYYWDSDCNLLAEKTSKQLVPMANRINKIIKDIQENPSQMTQYFLTSDERELFLTISSCDISRLDSGFVPVLSESSSEMKEESLLNFLNPEILGTSENIQSMEPITILTHTVSALTDEIKTLNSKFSEEINALQSTINSLKGQIEAMAGIIGILVRREMNGVNVMTQSLI
ncbi:uncharacterized protein [Fopius arisanus]|nr:PREDICTED: uncharacterized protein LOC105264479 isoform X2 [Fopius arisanus]